MEIRRCVYPTMDNLAENEDDEHIYYQFSEQKKYLKKYVNNKLCLTIY